MAAVPDLILCVKQIDADDAKRCAEYVRTHADPRLTPLTIAAAERVLAALDDPKPAAQPEPGNTGPKCPDCDQSGRHFCEGRRQVVEPPA